MMSCNLISTQLAGAKDRNTLTLTPKSENVYAAGNETVNDAVHRIQNYPTVQLYVNRLTYSPNSC